MRVLQKWCSSLLLCCVVLLAPPPSPPPLCTPGLYGHSSVSVFALHPLYTNIRDLGPFSEELTKEVDAAFASLNAAPDAPVDYEATMEAKLRLLRKAFKEKRKEVFASEEYIAWFAQNERWLRPYGLYCVFRDLQVCSRCGDA